MACRVYWLGALAGWDFFKRKLKSSPRSADIFRARVPHGRSKRPRRNFESSLPSFRCPRAPFCPSRPLPVRSSPVFPRPAVYFAATNKLALGWCTLQPVMTDPGNRSTPIDVSILVRVFEPPNFSLQSRLVLFVCLFVCLFIYVQQRNLSLFFLFPFW